VLTGEAEMIIRCQAVVLSSNGGDKMNEIIYNDKTTEGQSTIETIDFSLVKSNNGVEYFIGEIPIEEVRSI
jgi:hypothetical protein